MKPGGSEDGLRRALVLSAFAVIYVVLGLASFSTAYVQANTAAVWLPTGFAIGLLLARGYGHWPAVLVGSFVLNTLVNTASMARHEVLPSLAPALVVALGNTAEALAGAYLTNTYAHGTAFFLRLRSLFRFLIITVPLAPILSAVAGVSASSFWHMQSHGSFLDVLLTWYVANAAGVLVFTGLTVLLLTSSEQRGKSVTPLRAIEAAVLSVALVLGTQAVCGIFMWDWMVGWPRAYMLIPLVIWASFRFRATGGLLAVGFITIVASLGTMNGFVAFPAPTPWRALVYLQIFLGMLAIVALTVSAAVAEVETVLSELEHRVAARTRAIEHLLEQRDVVTALIVHDLKGPIYGVRNALKALRTGLVSEALARQDMLSVIDVSEQTCTTVADRATGLLSAALGAQTSGAYHVLSLQGIIERSRSAHLLAMRARNVVLELEDDSSIELPHGAECEYVLDTLIDNAIRNSPERGTVHVVARALPDRYVISVIDEGPGVPEAMIDRLFERKPGPGPGLGVSGHAHGTGLGLHLAKKQAEWIGGSLDYEKADPAGARFTLSLPLNAGA